MNLPKFYYKNVIIFVTNYMQLIFTEFNFAGVCNFPTTPCTIVILMQYRYTMQGYRLKPINDTKTLVIF